MGGWSPLDLTPLEYAILLAVYAYARLEYPLERVKFFTRDVCERFTKLIKVEDGSCRRTSRLLNQLSRRLIVNGTRVIDRVRGPKRGIGRSTRNF